MKNRIKSVAVDPNSTSVVYVGGAGGYFSSATALLRSIDGGRRQAAWSFRSRYNIGYRLYFHYPLCQRVRGICEAVSLGRKLSPGHKIVHLHCSSLK
ncbi:MAG: hypothetical protein IJG16_05390, partial [Clostridia bacterium]|nr:hypothetical protein [Clostridia bacterium]